MVNVDNFAICFIFFVHHKNKVDHDAKWDDNLSHHQSKKKKKWMLTKNWKAEVQTCLI